MKTRFRKSYSRILPVVIAGIVFIICTACGEKEVEQKMMVSTIGTGYINNTASNKVFLSNEAGMGLITVNKAVNIGQEQLNEKIFCSINDFDNFHYYLFCKTYIGTTATVNPIVNVFFGDSAETTEAGVEVYQKFMEPLRAGDRVGDMELRYISPDCRFAVTTEDVTSDVTRWRLFDGEKELQVTDSRYENPFRIIKTEDAYAVINGETFDRIEDKLDAKTGYCGWLYNEQGDLAVGDKYNKLSDIWEMVICDLESEEVLWTFHGKGFPELRQLQGDQESGKVVLRLDSRYFYELTYPSGDLKYLGKDMYCLSYSPDRKYVAYSEPCNEDAFDLNEEEYKR